MFCKSTGIDQSKVKVVPSDKPMASQVSEMLKGSGMDGAFGFVNTIIASVAPQVTTRSRSASTGTPTNRVSLAALVRGLSTDARQRE